MAAKTSQTVSETISEEKPRNLSLSTINTPPTFLVQAEDDYVDGVNQSRVYYAALVMEYVPAGMHLYAYGGHAFGLRPMNCLITGWPRLAEKWLRTIGIVQQ